MHKIEDKTIVHDKNVSQFEILVLLTRYFGTLQSLLKAWHNANETQYLIFHCGTTVKKILRSD